MAAKLQARATRRSRVIFIFKGSGSSVVKNYGNKASGVKMMMAIRNPP
jgi:hypothetical protein